MTEVIDVLVAAGARPESVEEAAAVGDLTGCGADPNLRDARQGRTALEWCREGLHGVADRWGHDQVEGALAWR
jgi:hypothetical protein